MSFKYFFFCILPSHCQFEYPFGIIFHLITRYMIMQDLEMKRNQLFMGKRKKTHLSGMKLQKEGEKSESSSQRGTFRYTNSN